MTVDIILYFDSTRLLLPYHPPTNFKDNFRHEFRILKLSKKKCFKEMFDESQTTVVKTLLG
ncbi:hypothetical protein HanRHA438_Chr11g0486691 [Helianthus annuus]|nr:hypothetical protein HanRHA438_Chr11g0486691 [Helianthus annuus]